MAGGRRRGGSLVALDGARLAGPSAEAQARPHTVAARAAVTGNTCPSMVFEPDASLYPAQPSFHAGYDNWIQKFDDSTAKWGFVISGQFPYALWMSWTVYTAKGVPTFTFPRTGTRPDPGSVNPFQTGVRMLAPSRSYHLYLMPATTPESVIETMKSQFGADNVATLPPFVPTGPNRNTAWGLVQRSYWSFAFDGTADWDRFGYGGPTDTPFPTMHAFHTDGAGGLTTIPVENCGAESLVPKPTWHNPKTGKPIINAAKVPRPVSRIVNVPEFLIRNGFVVASSPAVRRPDARSPIRAILPSLVLAGAVCRRQPDPSEGDTARPMRGICRRKPAEQPRIAGSCATAAVVPGLHGHRRRHSSRQQQERGFLEHHRVRGQPSNLHVLQ